MRLVVAMALGLTLGGLDGRVSEADQIFFPHLVRSSSTTTIVSVVNVEPSTATHHAEQLRYAYFHKSGNAAGRPTAPCLEVSFARVTSPNDVQTFDVGDRLAPTSLGVLFHDPSLNNDYRAVGQSYSGLAGVAPPGEPDQSRAFLLVDNNDPVDGGYAGGRLYGEALILDFATGAAWGYRAYNSMVDEALWVDAQVPEGTFAATSTFSNAFETEGEVLNGASREGYAPVHLLPDDDFTVRFLVTPVAASRDGNNSGRLEVDELGNQRQGDLRTGVQLTVEPLGVVGGVAFDRDENPISGPVVQDVACVAQLDVRGQLLSQGVLNQLKQGGSDGGGWSLLRTLEPDPDGGTGTPEAVVFRLDGDRAAGAGRRALGAPLTLFTWLRNGADHNEIFESLMPLPLYDVPNPAGVRTWGGSGLPGPYVPVPDLP